MNISWRTLRSLRQAGPCSLVATYRAGAIARLVHKESPLARNEADLAHLNIKKSSEGAVPQEPLVSGSRAVLAAQIVGVGAQIAEVAGSIKSVQGQIVERGGQNPLRVRQHLSRGRDLLDHLWRQGRGQDIRSEPRSR